MKKTHHLKDTEETYHVVKPFFAGHVKKSLGDEIQLHKNSARPYINGGFLTPDKKLAHHIIRERIDFLLNEIDGLKKMLSPTPTTRSTNKKDAS